MRIQKYFSQNKIMSRRETEDYIRQGLISCNGKVVKDLGFQMDPAKDKIKILKALKFEKSGLREKITFALNKPKGFVSSKNKSEGKTIFEISDDFLELNAVGRLDKESEGLILLSNDGVITSAVTGSDHKIEKEYEVKTREKLNAGMIRKMENGLMLDDGMTLPAEARLINDKTFRIILREGSKHQIRRMAAALNLTILQLKRLRVGNITLDKLPIGKYRKLSESEIQNLKKISKN
ncbi:MAG: rRNA pseudouridine synthase [Candidatus Niyogibacteria bacterium]|nr:rRNA pseudouridine synthase [Candidatus Niyogibacteria bacterium]